MLFFQVLVATSTLAWGVNTPAHLVIIKGTEFFDAPTRQADRLLTLLLCAALQPAHALRCQRWCCMMSHSTNLRITFGPDTNLELPAGGMWTSPSQTFCR